MLLEFRLNFLKIVNVTSSILQQCHSIISIQRGERSPSFRCKLDRIVPEQLLKYRSWWPKTRWPSSLLLFFKSLHRNLFYLWWQTWTAENSFCLSTCPSLYISHCPRFCLFTVLITILKHIKHQYQLHKLKIHRRCAPDSNLGRQDDWRRWINSFLRLPFSTQVLVFRWQPCHCRRNPCLFPE